ncbi:hypothetical protein [Sulfobacillus harzensis]|uniref:Uncharacterized protein n=1 Tax=Sulfobacillus harzensis TaxID=2729629 RepID=A0A7Y0Q287_9FIRM|nr:hypothetical protein [Sulfobacillus harzensis]NMP22217.1 hypothetical protein [Sulfobacillus harzensis]
MFQLLNVTYTKTEAKVTILLDDTKVDAHGNPDRHFVVTETVPAPPPHRGNFDTWLADTLQQLDPVLTNALSERNTPPYDPIAKWRGFKWVNGTPITPS